MRNTARPRSTPNRSVVADDCKWTSTAPTRPAMPLPRPRNAARIRTLGRPTEAATIGRSRTATASRTTGDRSSALASASRSPSNPSSSQKARWSRSGPETSQPNREIGSMLVTSPPPVKPCQLRNTSSSTSLRPSVAMAK
jgi:hypothetical protein